MRKRWKYKAVCLTLLLCTMCIWFIYIYSRRKDTIKGIWDKRKEENLAANEPDYEGNDEDEQIYRPLYTHEVDPNKDIFFFETTGSNILHPRHACAVEAASKYASEYTTIFVLMISSDLNYMNDVMLGLVTLPHIKFRQVKPEFYFRLAGMEKWYHRVFGYNVTSIKNPILAHQLEQSLRYVFLFYHGGTYISKNFILMKPIYKLPDGFGLKSPNSIGDAVIKLKYDHPLMQKVLQVLKKKFQIGVENSIGVQLLEDVLLTSCELERIGELLHTDCPLAPKLYPSSYLYPIDENKNFLLFDELRGNIVKKTLDESDSYGVNIWNPMNASLVKQTYNSKKIALLELAEKYCPLIFYTVNEN